MKLEPLPERKPDTEEMNAFKQRISALAENFAWRIFSACAKPLIRLDQVFQRPDRDTIEGDITHEAGHALIGYLLRIRMYEFRTRRTLTAYPRIRPCPEDLQETEDGNPTEMFLLALAGCAANYPRRGPEMRENVEKEQEWSDITIPRDIIRHLLMRLRIFLGPDHYPTHKEDLDGVVKNILLELYDNYANLFRGGREQPGMFHVALEAVEMAFRKYDGGKYNVNAIVEMALRERGIGKAEETAMLQTLAKIDINSQVVKFYKVDTPLTRSIDEETRALLSHTHIGKKWRPTE